MSKVFFFYTLLLIIGLFSCGPRDQSNTLSDNADSLAADVSELAYFQLWELVMSESGGAGIDFHGDEFGMEAVDMLSFETGAVCGSSDCGNIIMLSNNGAQNAVAVVKATFSIPGNPNSEMVRQYNVPANTKISVGCSHLCYADKSYKFSREIVTAGFDNEAVE